MVETEYNYSPECCCEKHIIDYLIILLIVLLWLSETPQFATLWCYALHNNKTINNFF